MRITQQVEESHLHLVFQYISRSTDLSVRKVGILYLGFNNSGICVLFWKRISKRTTEQANRFSDASFTMRMFALQSKTKKGFFSLPDFYAKITFKFSIFRITDFFYHLIGILFHTSQSFVSLIFC